MGVEGKDSKYKEGHCCVGRFDNSLKNNWVDFLRGGVWSLKSQSWSLKSQSSPYSLPHTHPSFFSRSPVSILMCLYQFHPIPQWYSSNSSSNALQAFYMKEAEDKISGTGVMSLPGHLRKLGLIKCTTVGIKHISSLSGLTFLKMGWEYR